MKTKPILALLLAACSALGFTTPKPNYVGYKHKGVVFGATLPNGVKDLGGGLTSNENYGVSRFSKGKNFMLWLEKITARDYNGVPSWEVKDVLLLEAPKKNQEFFLSYSSTCTQNGKSNIDLIVLAEFEPKSKIYAVKKAWMANVKREKIERTTTRNIKCEYVAPERNNRK